MKALITGITGQDGSYLAEYLLSLGYTVHGIIRRASTFNTHRIDHVYTDPIETDTKLFLHYGDLSDSGTITELIGDVKPDEIYHLGAQSHVRVSFDMPEYTANVTALGTIRILEAIRQSGIKTRLYQASSSEMFGGAQPPQNESTPFMPKSPYAAAKAYAFWSAVNYRESYNIFASNGILFNHESPRRGETFITRKITRGFARILNGKNQFLALGNLGASRDWGFAPEYVEVMQKILSVDKPDDFVIGTGICRSVRDFIMEAAGYLGIEIEWKGKDVEEKGIVKSIDKNMEDKLKVGTEIIRIHPKYFRPSEPADLRADYSKATKILGWTPRIGFEDLVKIMVDHDMVAEGLRCPGEGFSIMNSKGFRWTNHIIAANRS